MTATLILPKKLIEVALPLDAINAEAAREKSIRHGHPSTLHLWWARRPLAAARAVIFGQLVNDPEDLWRCQNPGQTPISQQKTAFTKKRKALFDLISDFVKWDNTTNEELLKRARKEIRDSWREVCALNKGHPDSALQFDPEKMPGLHDPFAGGGTIPLEAQRLGLEAFASDLNPVAVLINKAMIEIPPKFAGQQPVHPDARRQASLKTWKGAQGLAEDVRRYAAWMRDEAEKQIGHLYPKVTMTAEMAVKRPELKGLVGQELTVVAWLWARTVKSPNPAFSHVAVPLVSTFVVSSKVGKESWVEPIVQGDNYHFEVRTGAPPVRATDGTKAPGRGADFQCILSGAPIHGDYIKAEGNAGRMGVRLMAIVADGSRSRVYLDASASMEEVAATAHPEWRPVGDVPARLTGGTCVPYGLRQWGDLFTPRQLVALTTFCDLVALARESVRHDGILAGMADDGLGLEAGGAGATAYAEAVCLYLAFSISKLADRGSTICTWFSERDSTRNTFSRQSLPMTWDFAELNTLLAGTGSFEGAVAWTTESLEGASGTSSTSGQATQADAQSQQVSSGRFVSTDPPYYDNIAYADLSDFFYVWLRRSLRPIMPALFASIAVPKSEELVATAYRHGTKDKAEAFFLAGMTQAMHSLATQAHPGAPVTIYYAFKQSETKGGVATSSTGWETFLEAVLRAGFALTGTWPMRTELGNRMIGSGTNALASSIILVCRPRPDTATTISRREFIRELNAALPLALDLMTRGADAERSPVAPVDLSQAIIGPGMAVFSKYAAVLEADGTPMTVRTALQLINRFLAEDDFDRDTQFCLHWFDQYGWNPGAYGEADVLARAKATSVGGLVDAHVVESGGGKVRLLRPAEYPADWDPSTDKRLPVWEALHHLVRAFRAEGESGAARVLKAVESKTEPIRQLAYRLYTLCERRGWADDARAYNELVGSWASVETAATSVPVAPKQQRLFGDNT
jgi:putative DNA methylase